MPILIVLLPPVMRRKPEFLLLSNAGDTVEVSEIDGFWQGLIEQGVIAVSGGVEEEPTEREVLEAMNKATLAGIAVHEGIAPKGLNKAEMIDAILAGRIVAAAQEPDSKEPETEGQSEEAEVEE